MYAFPRALCLLLTGLGLSALANASDPEVIVIYGGPVDEFKIEEALQAAEENLYKLFSQLNDDEDYDVECHYVQTTGSRLSHTECRPNFLNELMMDYGADAFNIPQGELDYHKSEMQRRLLKLLEDSAELRTAALTHAKLKQRLAEVRRDSDPSSQQATAPSDE